MRTAGDSRSIVAMSLHLILTKGTFCRDLKRREHVAGTSPLVRHFYEKKKQQQKKKTCKFTGTTELLSPQHV